MAAAFRNDTAALLFQELLSYQATYRMPPRFIFNSSSVTIEFICVFDMHCKTKGDHFPIQH